MPGGEGLRAHPAPKDAAGMREELCRAAQMETSRNGDCYTFFFFF